MIDKFSIRLTNRLVITSYGRLTSHRRFTTVCVHSRLPATVYRLQLRPKSNLSTFGENKNGNVEDQVLVSSDGLVYPRVSQKVPTSNGPLFIPNTILMQDLARNAFDQYRDQDEASRPVLISIKKGTVLPPPLIAFHQDPSLFSLQPFHPMKLQELNNMLDEFYATHATVFDAEEWFDKNNFHEAAADADTEQWQT